MRVLHINVSYIVSALHQTMIEHMNKLGVESKVFVPTYDKNRSIVECKDYVVVSECFKKWDRLVYYKKQRKIISSVVDIYDVSKFDIIHAYTLFTDGNVAMELSRRYGIPYVVAVRNTDVNDFFRKMIYLRSHGVKIMRRASAVFFLSPTYRDTVINKYVPRKFRDEILKKSHIIPNGIDDFWHENHYSRDIERKAKSIRAEKRVKGIFVGGIDKNKNVELSVKALEQLNNEGWNCSLTAIGRIVDKTVYDKLKEYPSFYHIEPKEKEALISYYRQADIFIMLSHHETFGLVYAEAMSQGLPIIYTRGQGFDGQFSDGYIGYSSSSHSIEETKNCIKRIVDNYEGLSHRCISSVDIFDWNKINTYYLSIYHDILSCKGIT